MARISLVLVAGCALLLGGCLSNSQPAVVAHYTLGPSTVVAVDSGPATQAHHGVLKIARISVPAWLAGTAMYYRLDYRHDNRLASYAQSDWAAPPASLLEPLLESALRESGGWQAVVGPHNTATADVSLRIKLEDFSQAFAQPQQSAGVIRGVATLVDNHGGRVIAQKHFHVSVAANSADAQAGVKALVKASHQLAAQLASCFNATCRSGGNRAPH